jgi:hypothetical protein
MKFKKFVIWLNSAVWLFFGFGFTIAPKFFASLVDADITKADGHKIMTDIGVMMIGIGIWYIYCVIDDSRIRHGLISAFLICFGMLVGRLIGIVVNGSANNINILYVILETLDSALLLLALRIKDKPA